MVNVIKKDGRVKPFRKEKIMNNLKSTQRYFNFEFKRDLEDIAQAIDNKVNEFEYIYSSDIFDIIKEELKDDAVVLSAFKQYKDLEQEKIDQFSDTQYQLDRLENKDKEVINENGNKDSRTFVTQRDLTASVIAKSKGIKQFSEKVQRAHIKGLIHLHDLDRFPYQGLPNCSLPNFEYLLKNGFDVGTTHVTPAQSIRTAISHLSILISSITGAQYGGITVHEIDKLLIPYAEKTHAKNLGICHDIIKETDGDYNNIEEVAKKMTQHDIQQSMEALEYEINTITAHSAQTPFSSISFGQSKGWLGREIQKAILNVRLKGMDNGDGGEITAIFPKLLFFVEEGLNKSPGDENYDIKELAMETSRKRIYPDLISVENLKSIKEGNVISPMGCRSYLHPWKRPSTGEYEIVGRNNIGVTSINLPRLAIQAEGNKDYFFELVSDAMDILIDSLHTREDVTLSTDIESAPIMYKSGGLYGGENVKSVRDLYTGDNRKRSTVSVGYVGLHNAMVALFGKKEWHKDKEIYQFSIQTLQFLQDYIDSVQDDFEVYVSLYSTPSESLADRFAKLDRERFGVIKDVNDMEYYENSFHYPSFLDTDPFSKIEFEAPYYKIATAGFMHYVEMPNLDNNHKAFESIWDEAHDKLCYFGINTPSDMCYECNFKGEFKCDKYGYSCPKCGNDDCDRMNVVRRLCGYLGQPAKRPVVSGKQAEIANRVKHN